MRDLNFCGIAAGMDIAVRIARYDLNIQRRQRGAGSGYGGCFCGLGFGGSLGSGNLLFRDMRRSYRLRGVRN